jgi:tetratricopeptide (TPR) repeat protein
MKKSSIKILGLVIGIFFIGNVYAQSDEGSKYGEDSVKCIENNSLYYEFFKQWKASNYKNDAWKDAYKPWRWVFINCPASTKNIYLHGERLVEEMLKNTTDKDKKDKYIDTLMMVYDKRIQYFGSEGYVLGKKGSDLYKLRPSDYEKSFNILKKSIELEGNDASGEAIIYYFRAAEKMVKASKADSTILVDIYDQVSAIIEFNLSKAKDEGDKARWENIRGNIELSFEPWAKCEDLISLYTIKFNDAPEDIELLKKITKILDKKDCTDSELFFKATENLHRAEPSARTAELTGKMYIKRERFADAVPFLQEAIKLYEDDQERADVHFLLANVFFQLKRYSEARAECYATLKVRPNDGKSYIVIGDLYAATAKDCGDGDFYSKVAYWAAVDKYYQARNVDPEVAELAQTKISTFTQYFPATEQIFFHDLKEGDSFTVECWINETTTVRSSD